MKFIKFSVFFAILAVSAAASAGAGLWKKGQEVTELPENFLELNKESFKNWVNGKLKTKINITISKFIVSAISQKSITEISQLEEILTKAKICNRILTVIEKKKPDLEKLSKMSLTAKEIEAIKDLIQNGEKKPTISISNIYAILAENSAQTQTGNGQTENGQTENDQTESDQTEIGHTNIDKSDERGQKKSEIITDDSSAENSMVTGEPLTLSALSPLPGRNQKPYEDDSFPFIFGGFGVVVLVLGLATYIITREEPKIEL